MAKIISPNNQYNGISAGVQFLKGVGECSDPYLIDWFKSKGYEVEDESFKPPAKEPSIFDSMDVEQLKAYAKEKGIDIGNSTSLKGIIKKIEEAEKLNSNDGDPEKTGNQQEE